MGFSFRKVTETNAQELAEWCGGLLVEEHDAFDHEKTSPGINVPTKDGVERASLGDVIAENRLGHFSVLKHKR